MGMGDHHHTRQWDARTINSSSGADNEGVLEVHAPLEGAQRVRGEGKGQGAGLPALSESVQGVHVAFGTGRGNCSNGKCQDQFFADLIFRGVRGSGHSLAVRPKGYIA